MVEDLDFEQDMEPQIERNTKKAATYNKQKFKSAATAEKYSELNHNKLTLERIIEFEEGQFSSFMEEIQNRRWEKLIYPQKLFNLDVVKQFYANSIYSEEARKERFTWVNKTKVYYDKVTINNYLGEPWEKSPELCQYQEWVLKDKKKKGSVFPPSTVRKALCVDGLSVEK